jgi:O-antigen ligase
VLALIGVLFVKLSPGSAWGRPYLALVLLLTLMAALTYSATAAAGLAFGCSLLLVARRMDLTKVAAMAGACLVVGAGLLASGHIDIIVEGKLKSIEAHTRTKTDLTPTPMPTVMQAPTAMPSSAPTVVSVPGVQQPPTGTQQPASPPPATAPSAAGTTSEGGRSIGTTVARSLVGPADHVHFHETMYLLIYLNFGLLGIGLFISVQALTLYRAVQQWRSGGGEVYLLGAILLAVFLAMNSFLPLYAVFPVNLYMWVVVGMVWAHPLVAPVAEKTAELSPEPATGNAALVQS